SAFGSIWGAYLPVIDALRDSLEILHVQLYNSGTMFGIDGNIYTQGTADFIVAMTEAVIQGFNTSGGLFAGIPANKVAVGLPACTNAAGGGYTDTATVKSALDYLLGKGPKPGTYTLVQSGGYPTLRGMMTWSINWDAVNNCSTSSYQYAENFQKIFGTSTSLADVNQQRFSVFPNPASDKIYISTKSEGSKRFFIYDMLGKMIMSDNYSSTKEEIDISSLSNGVYYVKLENRIFKFVKY
ncbi:MAG: T9SS type A sorting domain-containing protein, partial [Bacteroidota bacterium]